VQAYKEMAFAIRRRNTEDRASERVRLSEAMREIQKDISFHHALIGRERSGRAVVVPPAVDTSGRLGCTG